MSRPVGPHRPFFPFGNPFKMMLPKSSYLSSTHLHTFEENLSERLRKLKPNHEDVLSLSWMRFAMVSLDETHTDIKNLITELELPVCDWDDKWIDAYLGNSLKLLDICIAFSSELSRLTQSNLLLKCATHNLNSTPSRQLLRARSSLDSWKEGINLRNSKLEDCCAILDNLTETLNLPKIKNSAKGKILMRAMYGLKVITVFVCSVFVAAFSGSAKKLANLQVPETYLWREAFTDLQAFVNGEIRHIYTAGKVTALKELETVHQSVKKLYPMVQDGLGTVEAEVFQNCCLEFGNSVDKLSLGLEDLTKEVDGFFRFVVDSRDALLCNFQVGVAVLGPVQGNNRVERVMR